jgi:hypothetical protein
MHSHLGAGHRPVFAGMLTWNRSFLLAPTCLDQSQLWSDSETTLAANGIPFPHPHRLLRPFRVFSGLLLLEIRFPFYG